MARRRFPLRHLPPLLRQSPSTTIQAQQVGSLRRLGKWWDTKGRGQTCRLRKVKGGKAHPTRKKRGQQGGAAG